MPSRQTSPSLELGVKSSNKAIADRLGQIKVRESVIVAGVYYTLSCLYTTSLHLVVRAC